MGAFVGRSHRETLARLVDAFASVRKDQSPRMVVLEGEIGVGKTRVVHELFVRLVRWEREWCVQRGLDPWWPERIDDRGEDVMATRGKVQPSDHWARSGEGLQCFGWIGIHAERKPNGVPLRALAEAVRSAELVNAAALSRADASLTATVRTVLPAIFWSAGFSLTVVGFAVGIVAAVVVGAVSLAITTVQLPAMWRDVRAQLRQRRMRREVAGAPQASQPDNGAYHELDMHRRAMGDLVKALAQRGLPTVVVLDDADAADDSTLAFVNDLLASEAAVLIVATARVRDRLTPAQVLPQVSLSQEGHREQAGVKPRHVRHFEDLVTAFDDRVNVLRLNNLDGDESEALVRSHIPSASTTQVNLISRWSRGSPLLIEAFFRLDSTHDVLIDGNLDLDDRQLESELDQLHASIHGIFSAHWRQLPQETRRLLAIAAAFRSMEILTPAAARTLVRLLVRTDAGEARPVDVGLAVDDSAAAAALEGARRNRWIVPHSEWIDRFADQILLEIAAAQPTFSRHRREQVQQILAAEILRTRSDTAVWANFDTATRRIVCALQIAIVQAGSAPCDESAVAAALELARTEDAPQELDEAIEHARLAVDWCDRIGEEADHLLWQAREILGLALLDRGRIRASIEQLDAVVTHYRSKEPSSQRTIQLHARLAEALRRDRQYSRTIELVTKLLESSPDAIRANDPGILEAMRQQLIAQRALSEKADSVVPGFRVLVDRHRHPKTHRIATRSGCSALTGLAVTLRQAGQLDEALAVHREAHRLRCGILGEQHHETLESLNNEAVVLRALGKLDDAIDVHRALHRQRTQLFGRRSRSALTSRFNLGWVLAQAGRGREAVSCLAEVVDDRHRAYGDAESALKSARLELGRALIQVGRLTAAEQTAHELLESTKQDQRRRYFYGAHEVLASVALLRGQPNDALTRVTPDHRGAAVDRLRASIFLDIGQPHRAAEILRRLHARQVDRRGPADLGAAGTATKLAAALIDCGLDSSEILAQVRTAIDARSIDRNHPLRFDLRLVEIAAREARGRMEENIADLSSVLNELCRVSGVAHVRTLTCAVQLVGCMVSAGRTLDAATTAARIATEARGLVDRDLRYLRMLDEVAA